MYILIKTYYKIYVNLICLIFINKKRIKTDITKRNKTFIKFKINEKNYTVNSLTRLRFLFEKRKNRTLFDRAFSFLSRKLTELDEY